MGKWIDYLAVASNFILTGGQSRGCRDDGSPSWIWWAPKNLKGGTMGELLGVLLLHDKSPCRLLNELPEELQELMSDLAVGESCWWDREETTASSRGTSKKGTSEPGGLPGELFLKKFSGTSEDELFCWFWWCCWAAKAAMAAICKLAAACRWKLGSKGG